MTYTQYIPGIGNMFLFLPYSLCGAHNFQRWVIWYDQDNHILQGYVTVAKAIMCLRTSNVTLKDGGGNQMVPKHSKI